MKRLLITVAFSALTLGIAAPGWAADTTAAAPSKDSSATQPMSAGQTGAAMPSNSAETKSPTSSQSLSSSQPTPSGTGTNTSASASDQTAMPKRHRVHHARAQRHDSDHMANELNRQELAKIAGSSSYGASGTTAPSTGTIR